MIPTVLLTFFVGLMCWETLNLMWGNHQGQKVSGIITPNSSPPYRAARSVARIDC